MRKVLITGITGFLGSHIAENLILNGVEVIGLKRKGSDAWRCEEFESKINWVDIDGEGLYKKELAALSFDTIIHAAWIGVEANDRNNWEEQIKNIQFLVELLNIGREAGIKKFIFLGSQAEYGNVNGKVSENQESLALNAYASIKLACLEILKTFCNTNDINWICLRVFSIFGERENENWLIPSLVKSMQAGSQMDFTPGEQKYAYLYVKDFADIINRVIMADVISGIYNVSGNQTRTIRSLVENIRDIIKPSFSLNFGVLNYRDNQSMHIEGDVRKIFSQIGEVEFTDFSVALRNTLEYYTNN